MKAYVAVIEPPFDHPERVLNLGAHPCLSHLDLMLHPTQYAALTVPHIGTARRDLPDGLATLMFRPLLYAGGTGIAHISFFAVEQPINQSNVRHAGRPPRYARWGVFSGSLDGQSNQATVALFSPLMAA